MAETKTMTIAVNELSNYGFKVGNEYFNWSKKIPETEKGLVVPGGIYEMELYVADSGKKYVNHVKANAAPAVVVPAISKVETPKAVTPVATKAKTEYKAKADTSMTKDEWKAKDRSQLIGGLSHDAATVVAGLMRVTNTIDNETAALAAYENILRGLLEIRASVE